MPTLKIKSITLDTSVLKSEIEMLKREYGAYAWAANCYFTGEHIVNKVKAILDANNIKHKVEYHPEDKKK